MEFEFIGPENLRPKRATINSIGYDIFSPDYIFLSPGERKVIPLGFKSKFTPGYAALLWDKSGLAARKGLTILAGLIDPDYRDEWAVVLFNTSKENATILVAEKICQLFFFKAEFPSGLEVENKERSGGFGSTGL